MADLPSNVGYGRVVGRFLLAVADTSDAGTYPDGPPAAGQVTFTPSPTWLLDATATPAPATIIPMPVLCGINSSGYLTDPMGNLGVSLVATDDPDLNPTGWTYTVKVAIDGQPTRTFAMQVPAGVDTDLALAAPVSPTLGTPVVRGEKGDKGDPGDMTLEELDAAITDGVSGGLAGHVADPDPHPQYLKETDAAATYAAFTDTDGNPIGGKSARIVFDAYGDVTDIVLEDN